MFAYANEIMRKEVVMIRGVKKNVIVVSPPKKSSFEKIFFVMRADRVPRDSRDIITEANRLAREGISRRGEDRLFCKKHAYIFVAGVGIGVVLGILTLLTFL